MIDKLYAINKDNPKETLDAIEKEYIDGFFEKYQFINLNDAVNLAFNKKWLAILSL